MVSLILLIGQLLAAEAAAAFPPCGFVQTPTKSWATIRTKGFTLSLPRAFKRTTAPEAAGLGEETWSARGVKLNIGYARTSEESIKKTYADTICETTIDGERAIVTTSSTAGKEGALLWFPDIHLRMRENGKIEEDAGATLLLWGDGKAQTLTAAFASLRFQDKKYAGAPK